MIIYRGWGLLVLVCYIGTSFLVGSILSVVFGIDAFAISEWWPRHAIFVSGAIVTFAVGRLLNREMIRETVYEKSGPVTVLKPRHTLYFIRMEYWGPIILAIYLTISVAKQLR